MAKQAEEGRVYTSKAGQTCKVLKVTGTEVTYIATSDPVGRGVGRGTPNGEKRTVKVPCFVRTWMTA